LLAIFFPTPKKGTSLHLSSQSKKCPQVSFIESTEKERVKVRLKKLRNMVKKVRQRTIRLEGASIDAAPVQVVLLVHKRRKKMKKSSVIPFHLKIQILSIIFA